MINQPTVSGSWGNFLYPKCDGQSISGVQQPLLILLPSPLSSGRKRLSDSHCWVSNSSLNDFANGNGNFVGGPSFVSDGPPEFRHALIVMQWYLLILGLLIAYQDLQDVLAAGHLLSKYSPKERCFSCIAVSFSACASECCEADVELDEASTKKQSWENFILRQLGEVLYYVFFVVGCNACLHVFLSPGQDISGYSEQIIGNSGYQGAGVWEVSKLDPAVLRLFGWFAVVFSIVCTALIVLLLFDILALLVTCAGWIGCSKDNQREDETDWSNVFAYYASLLFTILNILILIGGTIAFVCTSVAIFCCIGVWMMYLQLKNGFDLSVLWFPGLDFQLFNMNFALSMTAVFSCSLGVVRVAKLCSQIFSGIRQHVRGYGSRTTMLTKTGGPKATPTHIAKEQATEKAKDKLIEEADRRSRTKVFPATNEEDEEDEEDEDDERRRHQ